MADRLPDAELERLLKGDDIEYWMNNAFMTPELRIDKVHYWITTAVQQAKADALRRAADEQERLSTGPRALGNKAVQFKRLIFAQWLRERADQIEAGELA